MARGPSSTARQRAADAVRQLVGDVITELQVARIVHATVQSVSGTLDTVNVRQTGAASGTTPVKFAAGLAPVVGDTLICVQVGTDLWALTKVSPYSTQWQTSAPFNTGWTNYGTGWNTVSFRRIGNIVYLRGLAKRTSGTTATIFTLPVGFRPVANELFATMSGTNTVARVDVHTTGAVQQITGTASYCSLSGILFATV